MHTVCTVLCIFQAADAFHHETRSSSVEKLEDNRHAGFIPACNFPHPPRRGHRSSKNLLAHRYPTPRWRKRSEGRAGPPSADPKCPRVHLRVHQQCSAVQCSAHSTLRNSQTRNHHQSSLPGAPCNFGTNIIIVIIVIDANSGPARPSNTSLTRRPINRTLNAAQVRMKNLPRSLFRPPPPHRQKLRK